MKNIYTYISFIQHCCGHNDNLNCFYSLTVSEHYTRMLKIQLAIISHIYYAELYLMSIK